MSSHLNEFKMLYLRIGINCKVNICDTGYYILLGNTDNNYKDCTTSDKFYGWPEHFTQLNFDKEGQFVSQEFTE